LSGPITVIYKDNNWNSRMDIWFSKLKIKPLILTTYCYLMKQEFQH